MSQRRGLGKGLGALIPSGGVKVATEAAQPLEETSTEAGATQAAGPKTGPTQAGDVLDVRSTRPDATSAGPTETPTASAEDQPVSDFGLRYAEITIDTVSANPMQPRHVFDEDALQELTVSIREIGLLQPIVVRPSDAGYELIAGERRLRASQLAGFTTIPALVRETEDEAMLRDALLENLHRVQLNPLEEAAAYQQLLEDFDCSKEELATRIGRSRPQVSNTLRLLKLPPAVQRRVAAGVLSAGHARALLTLGDAADMDSMATRIVAEGLSVRAVEELATMGNGPDDKPRGPGRKRRTPVEYREAGDRIGDLLETRVRIEAGAKRGRIVVEFSDTEDLGRIIDLMSTGIED